MDDYDDALDYDDYGHDNDNARDDDDGDNDAGGGGRTRGEGGSCKQSQTAGDFHQRCHRDDKVSGDYDDDCVDDHLISPTTKMIHKMLVPFFLKLDKCLSSSSHIFAFPIYLIKSMNPRLM